jgi:hypothetical protein
VCWSISTDVKVLTQNVVREGDVEVRACRDAALAVEQVGAVFCVFSATHDYQVQCLGQKRLLQIHDCLLQNHLLGHFAQDHSLETTHNLQVPVFEVKVVFRLAAHAVPGSFELEARVLVKYGSALLELLQLGVGQLSIEPTLDSQLTEGQLEQPLGLALDHQLEISALRLARSVL